MCLMSEKNKIDLLVEERIEELEENIKEYEFQQMIEELETPVENGIKTGYNPGYNPENIFNLSYFEKKSSFEDIRQYYNTYKKKELVHIVRYYGLNKFQKWNASYMTNAWLTEKIIEFESLPENFEIVEKRHLMWAFIKEINAEPRFGMVGSFCWINL